MRFFAAGKQPQLSLEELCHVRWLLGGLLALLSVWTLFHLEISVWPFAAVATLTIVGTMLYPSAPAAVPRLVWRLLVPAIVVVFVIDVLTNEVVLSLVRLNTMLVMYRAASYRERRDDLQLIVLSLFLIVLTGVLTVSLVFVAQILLFAAVAMLLLFVINVVDDALAGARMASASWVRIPRLRLVHRLRQSVDGRIIVLGVGLFTAVIVVTAIIFVSVPRFEVSNPVNLFAFNRGGSLTGFSENIALGEITDLKVDDSVAMRIDIRGGAAVPPEPYWRMVVLDEYEGGAFRASRWVRDAVGDRSLPYLDLAPLQNAGPQHRSRQRENGNIVIFMEPGVSRYLPQPGGFSEIHFKETQEIVSNEMFHVYATRRQSAVLLSYQIEGADFSGVIPDALFTQERTRTAAAGARRAAPRGGSLSLGGAGHDAGKGQPSIPYPQTAVTVPVSATARAYLEGLVAEIAGGETLGAAEFANRACAYLERRHSYSRQIRLPPLAPGETEDPVVRWLRAGAGGHCEFFAAAFTLLARTAGHHVRVVAGFKGGTWNGFESYTMVRHSDAHAWCEIYDGAGAWLRVDPTPGAGGIVTDVAALAQTQVVRADRSTSAYLDSLRMLWYRRIVNFDQRSQRGMAETLRQIASTLGVWAGAISKVVRDQYTEWQRTPLSFTNKGDILYLTIVLFFVAVLMKRLGLGKSDVMEWLQRGQEPTRRRAGQLLRRMETRLANPPRRRSWDEEHALRLAGQLTLIRFGRMEHWPEPLKTFRAARRML